MKLSLWGCVIFRANHILSKYIKHHMYLCTYVMYVLSIFVMRTTKKYFHSVGDFLIPLSVMAFISFVSFVKQLTYKIMNDKKRVKADLYSILNSIIT